MYIYVHQQQALQPKLFEKLSELFELFNRYLKKVRDFLKKALILFQMTAEENAGRLRAFTSGLLWDRKGNKSVQYIAFYREKSQNKQAIQQEPFSEVTSPKSSFRLESSRASDSFYSGSRALPQWDSTWDGSVLLRKQRFRAIHLFPLEFLLVCLPQSAYPV